jgi:hypothetical protein
MALDMKAWLQEMGVSAHKIDDVISSFGGDVVTNIEKFGLRQSDYSQKMDGFTAKEKSLTDAQAKLDDANERLNAEMVDWAETQRGGGEITEKMRADYAKAQGEVARLTAVITTKATELGLDPKAIIGEVVPSKVEPPPTNLDGYAKIDDLNIRTGNIGRYLMGLNTQINKIQHEHQQLTGEWLDPETITAEIEARASDKLNRNSDGTFKKPIDARAIWEEKYQIPEKRATKSKTEHDTEIRNAEARGEERARSQAAIPGQSATGRHSPVLTRAGEADHQSKLPRPSQAATFDRVSKAASALATHKYRQQGSGATGTGAR